MAGSLQAAIDEAQRMAWDESIGYTFGGDGNPDSNGYDCSAFVIRCLYRAGYNVPAHRVGTQYMEPVLASAGFNIIPVTSNSQRPEPGDIVVMNHPLGQGGHTFFYMEDVRAYTDAGADSANIDIVHKVKIEASSTRGHTQQGDHRKNGNGAYWEVWCHAYYDLYDNEYHPTDPNDTIYYARDPNGLNIMEKVFGSLFLLLLNPKSKRRRIL